MQRSKAKREASEGAGSTESQEIRSLTRAIANKSTKDDRYITDFRNKIEADRHELLELVTHEQQKAAKGESSFCETLRPHLSASLRSKDLPSMRILQFSNQLILAYKDAFQEVKDATRLKDAPLGEEWDADKKKITELLDKGYRAKCKEIESLMQNKTMEDGAKSGSIDIGCTLHEAQRGVKRLSNGLSREAQE